MFLSIPLLLFRSCGGQKKTEITTYKTVKMEINVKIFSHVLWNPNIRIMYITYSSAAGKNEI